MESSCTIIRDSTVWQGRFMDVRLVTLQEMHGGKTCLKEREMAVRFHRVVCVLPITVKGQLVLIRQPRIYFDRNGFPEIRTTLEFPAGKVGDIRLEEDLEIAAMRELEEETGYGAGNLTFMFKESVSAGILSEERYCFLARDLLLGEKTSDEESDNIEVLCIDPEDVMPLLAAETARGVEIDSGVRSMLFYYLYETV